MRIIFFGSDPWFSPPVLEALLAAGHEMPVVVTKGDALAKNKKQKTKNKFFSWQAKTSEDISLERLAGLLRSDLPRSDLGRSDLPRNGIATAAASRPPRNDAFPPDAIVLASFGPPFLAAEVLKWPKYGCLNVHASLLPRWRGAAPVFAALAAGDKETGVSIMRMTEGVDRGPVLGQRKIKISQPPQKESSFASWSTSTPAKSDPSGFGRASDFSIQEKSGSSEDTRETLTKRLGKLGGELIVETLKKLEKGQITETPQPEKSPTPYTRKLTKESGRIDWSQSPTAVERFIRAATPWPGAWTEYKDEGRRTKDEGRKLKILKTHIEKTKNKKQKTKNILIIDEMQLPGKNPVSWKQFLAGHPGAELG